MLRRRTAIYTLFARCAYEGARRRVTGARHATEDAPAAPGQAPDPVAEHVTPEDSQPVERWGAAAEQQAAESALGWLDNADILEHYVFPLLFSDIVSEHWGENIVHNFGIPRDGHWLSLGCGGGNIEMQMAEDGLFASLQAFDPSPGAIEVARREAKRRGIDNIAFDVADVNSIRLPASTYDVVHINMALHHCSALERVAVEINDSLKDGGVFLANEFVGANQFQYPDSQVALVNGLLALLPDRLRWNPIAKEVKAEYPRFTRRFWNDWDPTESIRSDEIPGVLARVFPKMQRHDYNGTLLNLLLENIVQNFDFDDKDDYATMQALMRIERDLINTRVLPSDFALFVCPKAHGVGQVRGRAAATLDVRRRVTMAVRGLGRG